MDKQEPPATIKEVGIHIGYMREDIHALTDEIKDLKSGFATKEEVSSLKNAGEAEHQAIWDEIKSIKSTARWWVGIILTAIATATTIVALVIK